MLLDNCLVFFLLSSSATREEPAISSCQAQNRRDGPRRRRIATGRRRSGLTRRQNAERLRRPDRRWTRTARPPSPWRRTPLQGGVHTYERAAGVRVTCPAPVGKLGRNGGSRRAKEPVAAAHACARAPTAEHDDDAPAPERTYQLAAGGEGRKISATFLHFSERAQRTLCTE